MQTVRSSTQLDKKKANRRSQDNYDSNIEMENNKKRIDDRIQLEEENKKKEAARKNAAEKKDIKLRLNTLKNLKPRTQQDDDYRTA